MILRSRRGREGETWVFAVFGLCLSPLRNMVAEETAGQCVLHLPADRSYAFLLAVTPEGYASLATGGPCDGDWKVLGLPKNPGEEQLQVCGDGRSCLSRLWLPGQPFKQGSVETCRPDLENCRPDVPRWRPDLEGRFWGSDLEPRLRCRWVRHLSRWLWLVGL